MILNTKGTHGSISKDIKSFYDYVNNHVINSDFTRQIDDEISYLKLDSKVRREFMLLEARLLDERREAKAEGKAEGLAEGIAEDKPQDATRTEEPTYELQSRPRIGFPRLP